METLNEPTHPTDYRLVKLMDGSLLMGTISVDDNHMRIVNPLELSNNTSYDGVWVKGRYNFIKMDTIYSR